MTKQQEDTMYEIHTELTQSGLWDKFNAQLKKWKLKTNTNGKMFVNHGNMP